jgi:hypothetical protein
MFPLVMLICYTHFIIFLCSHVMLKNLNRERDSGFVFVSGLKVEYMIPNNPSSKRTYRVNNIIQCAAKLRYV